MAGNVYKHIEVTGTSTTTLEDAVQSAVARAAKSNADLRWFELIETRGAIKADKIAEWQVTIRIGCRME